MNRRKFIGVSSIGIIGTNSFVSSISHIFGLQSTDICTEVLKILGVSKNVQIDQLEDTSIIYEKLNNWGKSNYTPIENKVYYTDGERFLLIPLHQKNEEGSIIDNVVLVFKSNENDKLIYSGNLSRFHLESILWNKNELLKLGSEENIRNAILPYSGKGKPFDLGWSFETFKGSFKLSASLSEGGILISSGLYHKGYPIWENSFVSENSFRNTFVNTI